MDSSLFGIRGYLIDAPQFGALRACPKGAVIIENGKIAEAGEFDLLRRSPRAANLRWVDHGAVAILPGLIDCHTHLPQYPVVARGETELLPWLRQHIFPIERDFTGPRARAEAPRFFSDLARNGTTTAMVFSAIYEDSCEVGFEAAKASG